MWQLIDQSSSASQPDDKKSQQYSNQASCFSLKPDSVKQIKDYMMKGKDDIKGMSTLDIIQQANQKNEKLSYLNSQQSKQVQFINFVSKGNNNQKQEQNYNIQKTSFHKQFRYKKEKENKDQLFKEQIKNRPIKKQNNNKQKNKRKNDTNNTIKNYGRSIITFINKNPIIIHQAKKYIIQEINTMHVGQDSIERQIAQTQKIFLLFDQGMKSINKKLISQKNDLVDLWTKKQYSKLMRIISCFYFRKYCYYWIFNSKIRNYQNTIKYKARLQKIIRDPYTPQTLKWPSPTI